MTDMTHESRPADETVEWFAATVEAMAMSMGRALRDKPRVVRLVLACFIARGHLLLEDVPGTGKTMLAKALASTVQASHRRIQFTPDLLPSDVTGVTVYEQGSGSFAFHPGPIFHHIILADEINRASPKTQSALLEVMEEAQVTVDGTTHRVPSPFFVVATQNPIEQAGTYRLPEAQLDRFLMKTSIGHPDLAATEDILLSSSIRDRAALAGEIATAEVIERLAEVADQVYVDRAIARYVAQLAEVSRRRPDLRLGLSVRGCLAWIRVAKAWAAAEGRSHVVPEDIKTLAEPVLAHRLLLSAEASFSEIGVTDVIAEILTSVRPPEVRTSSAN